MSKNNVDSRVSCRIGMISYICDFDDEDENRHCVEAGYDYHDQLDGAEAYAL